MTSSHLCTICLRTLGELSPPLLQGGQRSPRARCGQMAPLGNARSGAHRSTGRAQGSTGDGGQRRGRAWTHASSHTHACTPCLLHTVGRIPTQCNGLPLPSMSAASATAALLSVSSCGPQGEAALPARALLTLINQYTQPWTRRHGHTTHGHTALPPSPPQAALRAHQAGSTRFCMGAAWRGPSQVRALHPCAVPLHCTLASQGPSSLQCPLQQAAGQVCPSRASAPLSRAHSCGTPAAAFTHSRPPLPSTGAHS